VNYSCALRWSIALLIPLTVAWKIAIPPGGSDDLRENLATFFARHDFNIVATDQMVNADMTMTHVPIFHAATRTCKLLIARLNFDGSNRQLVESRLANMDRYFIVFRGNVYAQQPTFLTFTSYLWVRFLTELGMGLRIAPAFAVGSNSSCDAERLPWEDLQY
jgi:hypothetical protein